eukprot:gb/GECG01003381.1/.p1 GENE.gb/GECG01003381.1/~~gb/GECG01003381.1/.p1  ORF type:complete len:990 (+),score=78.44 gb/GECG01003381.1/:1-2970(+)
MYGSSPHSCSRVQRKRAPQATTTIMGEPSASSSCASAIPVATTSRMDSPFGSLEDYMLADMEMDGTSPPTFPGGLQSIANRSTANDASVANGAPPTRNAVPTLAGTGHNACSTGETAAGSITFTTTTTTSMATTTHYSGGVNAAPTAPGVGTGSSIRMTDQSHSTGRTAGRATGVPSITLSVRSAQPQATTTETAASSLTAHNNAEPFSENTAAREIHAMENHAEIPAEFLRSCIGRYCGHHRDFPYHSATKSLLGAIRAAELMEWVPTCVYRNPRRRHRDCEFMFFVQPLAELLRHTKAAYVSALYLDLQHLISTCKKAFNAMMVEFKTAEETIDTSPSSLFLCNREAKVSNLCRKRMRYVIERNEWPEVETRTGWPRNERLQELKAHADATADPDDDDECFSQVQHVRFLDPAERNMEYTVARTQAMTTGFREMVRGISGVFVPKREYARLRDTLSENGDQVIDLKPKNGTVRAILAMFYQSEFPLYFLRLVLWLLGNGKLEARKRIAARIRSFHDRFLPVLLAKWESDGVNSIKSWKTWVSFEDDSTEVIRSETRSVPNLVNESTVLRGVQRTPTATNPECRLSGSRLYIPTERTNTQRAVKNPQASRNVENLVEKSFQMGWLKLQRTICGPVDIAQNDRMIFSIPCEWVAQSSRVVMFSMKTSDDEAGSTRHYWSPCYAYYVNSSFLNVPRGCKAPIDISSLCKPSENTVAFSSYENVREHVVLGVYESTKVTSSDVYRDVVNGRVMSYDEVKECLKTGFGCSVKCSGMEFADLESVQRVLNGGTPVGKKRNVSTEEAIEIQTDSFGVSVRDPVSFGPIALPVRGRKCNHLRSFDLFSFLKLNSGSSPKWLCPICNRYVLFGDIYLDTFFYSVLLSITCGMPSGTLDAVKEGEKVLQQALDCGKDVSIDWSTSKTDVDNIRTIDISADGSWRVVTQRDTHTRTSSPCKSQSKKYDDNQVALNGKESGLGPCSNADIIEILSDDDN